MMNSVIGRLWAFVLVAAVLAAVSFWGCSDPNAPEVSGVVTYDRVLVMQSTEAPPMDNPRSAVWDKAPSASITVGDSTTGYPRDFGKKTISLKAIKTADRLYVRAEWIDGVYDVRPNFIYHNRDTILGPPLYVDSSWVREPSFIITSSGTPPVYDTLWNEQDRFAIFWDFGDNGSEKADCLSMCHISPNAQGHQMYTTGGGRIDVWQWEAAITDPLYLASDEFWDITGQQFDQGDTLAIINYDTLLSQPIYSNIDTSAFLKPFLFSDMTVAYRTNILWPKGYKMPGYILNKSHSVNASNADIQVFSSYVVGGTNWSGRWLVAMSRRLSTGHADDCDFSGITPGDSIMTTIAVMDNSNRLHSGSKPIYFIFP